MTVRITFGGHTNKQHGTRTTTDTEEHFQFGKAVNRVISELQQLDNSQKD